MPAGCHQATIREEGSAPLQAAISRAGLPSRPMLQILSVSRSETRSFLHPRPAPGVSEPIARRGAPAAVGRDHGDILIVAGGAEHEKAAVGRQVREDASVRALESLRSPDDSACPDRESSGAGASVLPLTNAGGLAGERDRKAPRNRVACLLGGLIDFAGAFVHPQAP